MKVFLNEWIGDGCGYYTIRSICADMRSWIVDVTPPHRGSSWKLLRFPPEWRSSDPPSLHLHLHSPPFTLRKNVSSRCLVISADLKYALWRIRNALKGEQYRGGDLLEWPYQYTLKENFHKHELDKHYINLHLFSDLRNYKQFVGRPKYTKMWIFE